MDPVQFEADLRAKPAALRALADALEADDPWAGQPQVRRVLFVGMGSSAFAAGAATTRLLAAGFPAVSNLASNAMQPKTTGGDVVIAISASGRSKETLAAVAAYRGLGDTPIWLLTNDEAASTDGYAGVVQMQAGAE
ncbi:MAG: SIS domain-containing protein, partial [Actinomycetales bacterium]